MPERLFAQRYRLIGLLGRTGMSEVWSADDVELERRIALKLLAPDADRARFEREARAAAALAHPNLTQLYDYGEADGRPYMVLEYLSGGTLEDRLASGKALDDEETHAIAAGIAAGLAHAHDRGLVHRDLKPANILFDGEGRAKIADFGIARLNGGGTLTEAGTVLGTAAYIPPEQAAGGPATPARAADRSRCGAARDRRRGRRLRSHTARRHRQYQSDDRGDARHGSDADTPDAHNRNCSNDRTGCTGHLDDDRCHHDTRADNA